MFPLLEAKVCLASRFFLSSVWDGSARIRQFLGIHVVSCWLCHSELPASPHVRGQAWLSQIWADDDLLSKLKVLWLGCGCSSWVASVSPQHHSHWNQPCQYMLSWRPSLMSTGLSLGLWTLCICSMHECFWSQSKPLNCQSQWNFIHHSYLHIISFHLWIFIWLWPWSFNKNVDRNI